MNLLRDAELPWNRRGECEGLSVSNEYLSPVRPMNDERLAGGLPDAGGLNIDYTDSTEFEPTDAQLKIVRRDLETIADRIRPHLPHGFTVSTRVAQTRTGPQGIVLVAFPTGDAIGPGIQLTADMFDTDDDRQADGAIPPDRIVDLSREITSLTVAQWAEMRGLDGSDRPLPAQ